MNAEKTVNPEPFSWNRERSTEEISEFISRKMAKFDVIANELELALGENGGQ
jgi:hypothetical protein